MAIPNVKHVKVSVSGGVISCQPDRVVVSTPNTLLVFALDTPGYVFPELNPVVVNQPGAEFPYAAWWQHPKAVALFDRGNNTADYSYTVNVVDQFSGQRFRLDPTISNEGRVSSPVAEPA